MTVAVAETTSVSPVSQQRCHYVTQLANACSVCELVFITAVNRRSIPIVVSSTTILCDDLYDGCVMGLHKLIS